MVSYILWILLDILMVIGLNPYCSGQRSRTQVGRHVQRGQRVLILIVVDKGLVHQIATINDVSLNVLILIVVDKGLVR